MDKEARIKRIKRVLHLNKRMQAINYDDLLESNKKGLPILLGLACTSVVFGFTITPWLLVGIAAAGYCVYHLMQYQLMLSQEIAEETNQRLEKKLKELES